MCWLFKRKFSTQNVGEKKPKNSYKTSPFPTCVDALKRITSILHVLSPTSFLPQKIPSSSTKTVLKFMLLSSPLGSPRRKNCRVRSGPESSESLGLPPPRAPAWKSAFHWGVASTPFSAPFSYPSQVLKGENVSLE